METPVLDKVRIGQRIKAIRKGLGVSQQYLANCILTSTETVHKWEKGKSLISTCLLFRLGKYSNTSVDVILTGEKN